MLRALRGLKEAKAPGPDNIPEKILKDAAELTCVLLTFIFSGSLWMGLFPVEWKVARVSQIFKSGQQSEMNNCTPISVPSGVSGLFEKIVHN